MHTHTVGVARCANLAVEHNIFAIRGTSDVVVVLCGVLHDIPHRFCVDVVDTVAALMCGEEGHACVVSREVIGCRIVAPAFRGAEVIVVLRSASIIAIAGNVVGAAVVGLCPQGQGGTEQQGQGSVQGKRAPQEVCEALGNTSMNSFLYHFLVL